MATRAVLTSELADKYHMNTNTVKDALKKAKVKPVSVTAFGTSRTTIEWPNRLANAALRAYREEKPVRGAKKKVDRAAKVVDISPVRMGRQIDQLKEEVAGLRALLNELAPGIRKIVADLG